jgi:acrylyl-CoA reductase (NADPH)
VNSYHALVLRSSERGEVELSELRDDDLPPGDVVVDVTWSDLNYKDALVMAPGSVLAPPVPLVPGIDVVGEVRSSSHPAWATGDRVVVNGFGLGDARDGGLTQRTRVPGDWLLPVPRRFADRDAAAVGTAGFTAALAALALERGGISPSSGPVLVTGATGGVGSLAVVLLSALGFAVHASTRDPGAAGEWLRDLGAEEVVGTVAPDPSGALQTPRWAGAVDNVGGTTLAGVLDRLRLEGVLASVGYPSGMAVALTGRPFVMRGVTLAGIGSAYAPVEQRRAAWALLDRALDLDRLASLTRTVPLAEAPAASQRILTGAVRGRLVVDTSR